MNEPWKFIKEVYSFSDLPNDEIPEFIFWGRSNVGKSSLINLITKKKIAKTSKHREELVHLFYFNIKKILELSIYLGTVIRKYQKKNC